MTAEDTSEKRNGRRALWSLGKMFAGAALDRLFAGAFNPIFSALIAVAVAALVLLKTGILQISNWPTSAFIVLGVVALILFAVAFTVAVFWTFSGALYLLGYLLSWILKTPPPKRSRWKRAMDWVYVAILYPVVTVIGWISEPIGWMGEQRRKTTSPADGIAELRRQSNLEQ